MEWNIIQLHTEMKYWHMVQRTLCYMKEARLQRPDIVGSTNMKHSEQVSPQSWKVD